MVMHHSDTEGESNSARRNSRAKNRYLIPISPPDFTSERPRRKSSRQHRRAASPACDQPRTHGRAAGPACDQPRTHRRPAPDAWASSKRSLRPAPRTFKSDILSTAVPRAWKPDPRKPPHRSISPRPPPENARRASRETIHRFPLRRVPAHPARSPSSAPAHPH